MLEQLQALQGKTVVVELVNGRKLSGTLITVSQQYMRMETDEGVGTVPIAAIQVIWESLGRSVSQEQLEYIEQQAKDQARINCVGGFNCLAQYICRPPDFCSFGPFQCPGSYIAGGGGGSVCAVPGGFTCPAQPFYGFVYPGSQQQQIQPGYYPSPGSYQNNPLGFYKK